MKSSKNFSAYQMVSQSTHLDFRQLHICKCLLHIGQVCLLLLSSCRTEQAVIVLRLNLHTTGRDSGRTLANPKRATRSRPKRHPWKQNGLKPPLFSLTPQMFKQSSPYLIYENIMDWNALLPQLVNESSALRDRHHILYDDFAQEFAVMAHPEERQTVSKCM